MLLLCVREITTIITTMTCVEGGSEDSADERGLLASPLFFASVKPKARPASMVESLQGRQLIQ
jgi:hypothetical protein